MLKKEVLLLKIIESNASFLLLTKRGLSYSQIFVMIDELREAGQVNMKEDKFVLTEQGKLYLKEQLKTEVKSDKDSWIVKQEHYYKEPLSEKTIVLPKKI